jgi:hypothetical protein
MRSETLRMSEMADSSDARERRDGFSAIADVLRSKNSRGGVDFGFVDNALFLARKHASDEAPEVRAAVSRMLAAVGQLGASWRGAALETIDEIALQPSELPRSVASQAAAELRGERDS